MIPELTRILDYPKRGDDVKQVQDWLGIEVSGTYNKATKDCVKRFQKDCGLLVDGLVGPVTWAKMVEVFEPQPDPAHDYDYPVDDPMPHPEPDQPPLPKSDPIAWGGIGIGAAFLLAMLAYWVF